MNQGSRSTSVEDELRLPRAPGVIRRFWTRHPVFADVLITVGCLMLTLGPASAAAGRVPPPVAAVIATTSLVSCLLLLRRRHWPRVAFAAAVIAAAATLLAPTMLGGPVLAVATYGLAVYRSTRECVRGLAIGLGSLVLMVLVLFAYGITDPLVAANVIAGELVLGVIGALIGANVGNRRRYVEAIIDRSRQLLVERDQQAQLAAAAERTRIAREMHDIVSHSLTVIVALAEGAGATADRDRARAATSQIGTTARSALQEMRRMLGVLRDDSAAPLAPIDDDTVATVVDAARAAGFPVTTRISGVVPPHHDLGLAVGRIVQEGLTNAMRHAPGATQITVAIAYGPSDVDIDIRNDGVVPVRGVPGYGLRGLAERAAHVGGTFTSAPEGIGRWRLHAALPIDSSPEHA